MKRGIVDVSSLIWTSLKNGKDTEFGVTYVAHNDTLTAMRSFQAKAYKDANPDAKIHLVNSAGYGYENAIKTIISAMEQLGLQPHQLILVKEGMNSKAIRQSIHPLYKAGRDKLEPEYVQFQKCRDDVINVLLSLGAQMVWQDNVEADDVIGYLTTVLDGEIYIISNDKDLAVLVDKARGIHQYRMGQLDKNPFGDFDHKLITMYIALVGDAGDKIPGAKGFGDSGELSAWKKLWITFGDDGLVAMDMLIQRNRLKDLEEDVGELPVLQKIIDDAQNVYMSYELARLMIDKVNTPRRPLQFRAGMVKPRETIEDERLKKYGGVSRILSLENLDATEDWLLRQIKASPFISLDVETATPEESDAWIEAMDKAEDKSPVDVLASELTTLQLTFGPNLQFSVLIPIDHVEEEGCTNVPISKVAALLDKIPRNVITYIHNTQFELPVCFNAWGDLWKHDEMYHGFLRNVRDTLVMSSYADENRSAGLKSLSKTVLGYEQQTYQQTVTKTYQREVEITLVDGDEQVTVLRNEYPFRGKIRAVQRPERDDADDPVTNWTETQTLVVEHKMNELTARDVLGYGCDDTICTAALAVHFELILKIEDTWNQWIEVETWTAYVQALGFLHGSAFSLERMAAMEKKDKAKHDEAWVTLRQYLIDIGYEGTKTPTVVSVEALKSMAATAEAVAREEYPEAEGVKWEWDQPPGIIGLNAAGIKRIFNIITGAEMKTRVSTPSKLAKLIEQWAEENDGNTSAYLLAEAITKGDLVMVNQLVADNFSGEPVLDLNSPKQMAELLYDHMALPVNVTNKITDIEKTKVPGLFDAMNQHRNWRLGKIHDLTPEQWKLVRRKAKSDDKAIQYAIAFDADYIDDKARAALKAIGRMKKYLTRNQLFYKNYWKQVHWKTKRVHSSIRQCGTVTRRPTASTPNLFQLPKKGEGVEFRTCFVPHHKDAVVVSIDFSGQELRLSAERSQDKNMLACYVGDNLKDLHAITAAGAMRMKWGSAEVDSLFEQFGADLPRSTEGEYQLFLRLRAMGKGNPIAKKADDLRKDSKNTNFASAYGGQALKLSETLIMKVPDAQLFLDARNAMFPGMDKAAKRAEEACYKTGYALTFMGVRRHLREAIMSDNKAIASRAARQAWNMEIQGSAGEQTKLAMSTLWTAGAFFRYDVRFFASIYDELVVSVHKDHAAAFIKEMHAAMTQPYSTMTVPVVGSISLGPDFGNQIECGDDYDLEKINAALNDIFTKQEAAA